MDRALVDMSVSCTKKRGFANNVHKSSKKPKNRLTKEEEGIIIVERL